MARTHCTVLLSLLLFSAAAGAATVPYPDPGEQNPVQYDFTAAASGDVLAYFAGKGSAAYSETLGMLVNGVPSGVTGLDNQTSAYGEALDLGFAQAGDEIVFTLQVLTTGSTWYSQKGLDPDDANHVYSSSFAGNSLLPAGTYVGFEDLPAAHADFNYTDEQFVATNVSSSMAPAPVPLPSSGWLMLSALAGITYVARRRAS